MLDLPGMTTGVSRLLKGNDDGHPADYDDVSKTPQKHVSVCVKAAMHSFLAMIFHELPTFCGITLIIGQNLIASWFQPLKK